MGIYSPKIETGVIDPNKTKTVYGMIIDINLSKLTPPSYIKLWYRMKINNQNLDVTVRKELANDLPLFTPFDSQFHF